MGKEEDVNMNEMVQTEGNEQHQMDVENTETAQKDKAVNDNIAPLDVNEDNNENEAENDVDVSLQNEANENELNKTEDVNVENNQDQNNEQSKEQQKESNDIE